jgi:hypothetical protein
MVNSEIRTQKDIASQYLALVKSLNPDTNPDLEDGVFWILAQTYGGVISGLYQALYLSNLNTFPQTASGVWIDKHLASWNLPPRSAGMYAVGICKLAANATEDVTFVVNDQLTSQDGSLTYYVDSTVTVTTGTTGFIPVRSEVADSGYQQASGAILNLMTPVPYGSTTISSLVVISMTDGAPFEDDLHAAMRLLNSIQTPRLGGSKLDYYNWTLEADNSATDAYPVLVPITSGGNGYKIHLYVLSGYLNIDVLLNSHSWVTYSRTPNSTVISNVESYVEARRPFTDQVDVLAAHTYLTSSTGVIDAAVTLSAGYSLNANIPYVGLTAKNLINREIRRAVINSSQNPTLIGSTYYITAKTVLQQVINSLSSSVISPGIYAQILDNISVTFAVGGSHVSLLEVPNPSAAGQVCYDVGTNYAGVNVTEV